MRESSSGDPILDGLCCVLAEHVRRFLWSRCGQAPEVLTVWSSSWGSRTALREELLYMIAYGPSYTGPRSRERLDENRAQYGTVVDAFIAKHEELVAEIALISAKRRSSARLVHFLKEGTTVVSLWQDIDGKRAVSYFPGVYHVPATTKEDR